MAKNLHDKCPWATHQLWICNEVGHLFQPHQFIFAFVRPVYTCTCISLFDKLSFVWYMKTNPQNIEVAGVNRIVRFLSAFVHIVQATTVLVVGSYSFPVVHLVPASLKCPIFSAICGSAYRFCHYLCVASIIFQRSLGHLHVLLSLYFFMYLKHASLRGLIWWPKTINMQTLSSYIHIWQCVISLDSTTVGHGSLTLLCVALRHTLALEYNLHVHEWVGRVGKDL